MPGLSPVPVEKLGSFSNKELDLDFEFSNSVPSVADRAEHTNSTPLPNATVIKKTTIFFLYRITLVSRKAGSLQNTKYDSQAPILRCIRSPVHK
jgi:hypothetical protein